MSTSSFNGVPHLPICPHPYDEGTPQDPWDEMELLKKRMLREKSPGARMLISRMEAIDVALDNLSDAIKKYTPQDHHKHYAADCITLRYVDLKSWADMFSLQLIINDVEKRVRNFHLTPENTKLYPASEGMAAARAWRRTYIREQAKETRRERVAQHQPASHTKVPGLAVPDRPKATLKARTGTGSSVR